MAAPLLDLAELLPSWQLSLTAQNRSPATVKAYTLGVRAFLHWCEATGTTPELTRSAVQAFTAAALESGAEPASARARQLALKRFSAWLAGDGDETDRDQLLGLKPPKVDVKVTEALSDDDVKRMIKACQGRGLTDRRDEAIVRLMIETGCRAGELIGMRLADVDLGRGLVTITRGKGGRGRVVPFGPQTAAAIDRYLRVRKVHAATGAACLWIGGQGKTFGYPGLSKALKRRAEAAGIDGFHLHLTRHTAATRWLRAGGSEGGLMAVAGWKDRSMLDRYVAYTASERAADEARGLGLGDL